MFFFLEKESAALFFRFDPHQVLECLPVYVVEGVEREGQLPETRAVSENEENTLV